MTVSLRSLALGIGLGVALVAGTSALAAPLPKAPISPTKKIPGPTPTAKLTGGLASRASLTPRDLFDKGVSMNVHGAVRVEATSNTVIMDEHTQLWVHFRAEKNTDYDLSCQFRGQRSVLTMDYASGKFVRQQSTLTTSNGRLDHRIYARPAVENVKVYLQANGDIDWKSCTVEPVR